MPIFILLGSNHKWFACYSLDEAVEIAKEMFKNGCEYVKVLWNNEVMHWTESEMNI